VRLFLPIRPGVHYGFEPGRGLRTWVVMLGCTRRLPGGVSSMTPVVSPIPGTAGSGRRALSSVVEHRARVLAAFALCAIVAGGLLHVGGYGHAGDVVWEVTVALLAAELLVETGRTIAIDHHMGVDTIALVAMIGALALGADLAGIVVGLMFTGGSALEDVASSRARRELTALAQRAPKITAPARR
jgi:cation transport ATPase